MNTILEPADKLTTRLSGEKYVTLSMIIPYVHGMMTELQGIKDRGNLTWEAQSFLDHFMDTAHNRLVRMYETKSLSKCATLLDPRFKKEAFVSANRAREAQETVEAQVARVLRQAAAERPAPHQRDETQPQQWAQDEFLGFMARKVATRIQNSTPASDATTMVRQYVETPPESDADPYTFWSQHGKSALQELALGYLCIPATSVSSERLFSAAGQVVVDRRSSLSPENTRILVFLGGNTTHF